MRGLFFSSRATLLVGEAALAFFFTMNASAVSTGCRATPSLALEATARQPGAALASNEGYRLESVRWDPLLQQRFAVIRSCARPDLPSQMLPVNSSARIATSQNIFPVVHVGDVVRVVSEDELMRVEMTGVSEEDGAPGARIRVRLLRPSATGFTQGQVVFDGGGRWMSTVVRGPHQVELER